MKVNVLFLLLAIAVATTSSAAISAVDPILDVQLSTDQGSMSNNNGRVRRFVDGFDVQEMPKAKLKRGEFADNKSNVKGVKNDSGGAMAIFLKFIKDMLAHFNMDFDM